MGILIDASILIGWERGGVDLASHIDRRGEDETVFLSTVTVSELLHGVHRAGDPARRARRTIFVEGVIDQLPVLYVDLPTSRVHAEIWSGLAAEGSLIEAHDLWLAATCLAHDLTLVTVNLREFGRVSGLDVEDWSRPNPHHPS
jgi:tRNA(fMet)-specific endonuclease VapC